jgi:predicted glycoside hydrolase/deacetylase ChbG (UPF0249 family)
VEIRRLIVNADDLGMSRGTTDGILQAHQKGIVTSASLMVNQPASEYAIDQLKSVPRLRVGVHINLCRGRPLLAANEVPTLVTKEGRFYPYHEMRQRFWCWAVSPREVEAECRAQIRWMKERLLTPTHADSHDHLHLIPLAVRPFCRALLAEGIRNTRAARVRYWPRDGYVAGAFAGPIYRRLALTAYVELLQLAVFRGLAQPDCVVTCHPRYRPYPDSLGSGWQLVLENLPTGTYELACHPGFSEKGFSETDKLQKRRELEVRILTDPALRNAVERNGIRLINYAQLDRTDNTETTEV